MIEWPWFVSGGIVLFGFILFFLLARIRSYRTKEPTQLPTIKKRADAIKHYEKMRDRLSTRNAIEEATEQIGSIFGGFNWTAFIIIPIVLLVGYNVLTEVESSLCQETNVTNVSGIECSNGEIGGPIGFVFSSFIPVLVLVGVAAIALHSISLFK